MSVEFKFGDVAARIGRTDIAHVAETAGAIYICMMDGADHTGFCDDIQWDGIHEVRTVSALKDAQHYTSGTIIVIAGRPADTCDHMWLAEIKTYICA